MLDEMLDLPLRGSGALLYLPVDHSQCQGALATTLDQEGEENVLHAAQHSTFMPQMNAVNSQVLHFALWKLALANDYRGSDLNIVSTSLKWAQRV